MEVKEALLKRRSVRKFKNDLVSDEIIDELMHAGMSGPSACNKKPWDFYVIKDSDILEKIRHTTQFTNMNAPLAIVTAGKESEMMKSRMKEFWVQDLSAATENIMLRAVDYNLGSCWCGIYPVDLSVNKLREILNLPMDIIPFNIIFIGYPLTEENPRDQYDSSRVHII